MRTLNYSLGLNPLIFKQTQLQAFQLHGLWAIYHLINLFGKTYCILFVFYTLMNDVFRLFLSKKKRSVVFPPNLLLLAICVTEVPECNNYMLFRCFLINTDVFGKFGSISHKYTKKLHKKTRIY